MAFSNYGLSVASRCEDSGSPLNAPCCNEKAPSSVSTGGGLFVLYGGSGGDLEVTGDSHADAYVEDGPVGYIVEEGAFAICLDTRGEN